MTPKKLLIANRGEIALRIIRTARDMGIRTVQLYSTADADSLAVQLADDSIEIPGLTSAETYLNIPAVLRAAKKKNVDAIHPGYGFLSENADFATKVAAAGYSFIGPRGSVIKKIGDKNTARKIAKESGVPVVPGSKELTTNADDALHIAERLGFPVMIKATAGGGGRGIRLAGNAKEFKKLFLQAGLEANTVFGDSGLYVEKVIQNARHIEVQVLGDGKNVIHLFERECSLQRRRQKLWEEAPSTVLSERTRKKLCNSAVALAKHIKYRGAGTVEFLYDEKTNSFYFIEMNTRIQVEHPVTESITGIDIVSEMIKVCSGSKLTIAQSDVSKRGHSIEVRINAEDPALDFAPFPGVVESMIIPGGIGVRFDHMLYAGYTVPPYYDSLLGKLIVWGDTRKHAIARLKRALAELHIEGIKTTKPLFVEMADNARILRGNVHTGYLESWLQKKKLQKR